MEIGGPAYNIRFSPDEDWTSPFYLEPMPKLSIVERSVATALAPEAYLSGF